MKRLLSGKALPFALLSLIGFQGCGSKDSGFGAEVNSFQVTTRLAGAKMLLLSDTNRDGQVAQDDHEGRANWKWTRGALLNVNNDDDNKDGAPDAADTVVNGEEDEEDLTPVVLKIDPSSLAGARVTLEASAGSGTRFNVFKKAGQKWVHLDLSKPQTFAAEEDLVLAAEARQYADGNWNGRVTLNAALFKQGEKLAQDSVELKVSPWLISPNTAKVSDLYVRDRGQSNSEFIAQLKGILVPIGVAVHVAPQSSIWQNMWMQDTMEIGYSQFPSKGSVRSTPVVLRANRGDGLDEFAHTLLKPGFGWFAVGSPRALPAADQWTDWYGNLEVTPPLSGYPMGRAYYGNSGVSALHPKVVGMINAQEIQGPAIDIDTSWLLIRHVDEVITFVPTASGKPLMLVTSPGEGVRLLETIRARAGDGAVMNRGLPTQVTIGQTLADKAFINHNVALQSQKIEPLIAKLVREFGLEPAQVVRIPSLIDVNGEAWVPSMVNSVYANGHMLVSDPRGALVDGEDLFKAEFRRLVSPTGAQVHFINDFYYHTSKGNTHCATNTVREGQRQAFWQVLPERLQGR